MNAIVYSAGDWMKARARRAAAGKAPRSAIMRTIALRETPAGTWAVCIYSRRFGVWGKPEHYCSPTSYDQARNAVIRAWRKYRLPIVSINHGDNRIRPFRLDRCEMIGGAA